MPIHGVARYASLSNEGRFQGPRVIEHIKELARAEAKMLISAIPTYEPPTPDEVPDLTTAFEDALG